MTTTRRLTLVVVASLAAACSSAPTDDSRAIPGAAALTPDAAPKPVIDSLTGDVTVHEVATFLAAAKAAAIPTSQYPNGGHNNLADGNGGTSLEGINRMYEVAAAVPALASQSEALLDLAIAWSDAWLSHRNDLPLGEHRVMWTGKVEPVWPPDAPPSTYAACEVGETVGILAYTALNIVRTPGLAKKAIPGGDPNHYGATYLERAKTYVSMLELTMDEYFNKNFLDAKSLTIHHPDSAAYNALGSNNVNAWNREMMFLHAWQTLGEVHVALGDDPARAAKYKTITENTVDLFVKNAQPRTAPDGTPVYDWGYGNFGDQKNKLTGEQIGIHAQYDIWGLTRAYRAGYTSATPQEMKTYADTVVHELTLSPGVYAGNIDRCCSTQTYDYLPAGFLYLSPYDTAIFEPAATADIKNGAQGKQLGITADILWNKHWIFTHAKGTCTKTTCAAQGKTCGSVADGCGGTLACGTCPAGEACSSSNVCQAAQGSCAPTISSYALGTCNATAIYAGALYECTSQAAGVNGEPSGCGAAGVYCSSIPPDDAAWGTTAWKRVQSCP